MKSVKGTNKLTNIPQTHVLPDFAQIALGAFPLGISVFQRFHKARYRLSLLQVVPRIVNRLWVQSERGLGTARSPVRTPGLGTRAGPGSPVGPRSPAPGALGVCSRNPRGGEGGGKAGTWIDV